MNAKTRQIALFSGENMLFPVALLRNKGEESIVYQMLFGLLEGFLGGKQGKNGEKTVWKTKGNRHS